jgi:hypothetical protein
VIAACSGIARGGGGVVEGLWLCGFVGVVKTDGCRVRGVDRPSRYRIFLVDVVYLRLYLR